MKKNCRICLHHQREVRIAKARKRVHQIATEHATSVTVLGCGNAIGSAILGSPTLVRIGKLNTTKI